MIKSFIKGKNMIRQMIPKPLKKIARQLIKAVKYAYRRQAIKRPISQNQPIKIILGAAETYREGWYSSNENWLDITNPTHWKNVMQGKQLLIHAVAEHVFEHLTYAECQIALKHISNAMQFGGRLRIAVPDGYNPNTDYIRHVGINGIGDDASDHKQLLNVDVLTTLLTEAGFKATPIEWYDKGGTLHTPAYAQADGFIQRSRVNAPLNYKDVWAFPDSETSLIIDGIK
jgi:predicted SAM-dependent methyltransferase